MIPLASYDGCHDRYSGRYQGASLLVAGRGGPKEKLFIKGQLPDARKYATTNRVTLDNVHVTSLCHDAVVALLGA